MSLERTLKSRSNSACELCGNKKNLSVFGVDPKPNTEPDNCILCCSICKSQIEMPETMDVNHWRCLNDSMWSEVPAVQVMAWRLLSKIKHETWPQDLLDMLYLDQYTLEWAKDGYVENDPNAPKHVDSNGSVLEAGDTVVLIKDLNVKGASFTAKRGTAVRRISLVQDNPEHIEGKINGQHIVILTQYVKKTK